ncbi:MAG: flagellar hook-associated protein FlgK [Treponemataceae bacterium]
MSSFAGIEMAKRGLMVQSKLINTAGHNINNADTEGFSRQRVKVAAFDPLHRPDLSRDLTPGQIGQGVKAESIERIRDELLDARIAGQTNKESFWSTREKYYTMLEQVYNEAADISVRTSLDKFWQSWQELSVYPESTAARQAVVSRGESLITSINNRYDGLKGIGDMLNSDIEATVRQVNDFSSQIAAVNSEITRSRAMGDNPNDLLDRRDLLVEKLSNLINISTDQRDSDEFMVHVDGKVLVQGEKHRSFSVVPEVENKGYSKVIWSDTEFDADFRGGTLGALIELRDSDVRSEIQSLNTMTLNFADLVNDIHRNSIGANNATGLDFFVEQPFVTNAVGNYDRNGDGEFDSSYIFRLTGANELKANEQIGLAGTITLAGKQGNINIGYSATDTVQNIVERINNYDGEVKAYLDNNNKLVLKATTADDIENPDFVIRHVEDSGHFLVGYAGILAGSGQENAFNFNQPNAVNALSANGAQFSVAPVQDPSAYIAINETIRRDVLSVGSAFVNNYGVRNQGDGAAALAIAGIRNNPVMIGKSRTFDDYFADSVTNIALKAEQADYNMKSQNTIMGDLRAMRDAISGVNVDEELADIIKFQHGYNAVAKYVTVIDQMLDTVINRLKA